MTHIPCASPASSFPPPAKPLHWRRFVLAAGMMVLLAACSSPLPPQKPLPTGPLLVPPPAPIAAPVVPSAASAAELPGQSQEAEAGPTNPKVAARFPPPPVEYRTPGLEAGRSRFTTDSELHIALQQLEREGGDAAAQATIRLLFAGTSQRGVPIEGLLLAHGHDIRPQALRDGERPTVMFIAGQHGDEPAGAEAMLVLARQLANGPLQSVLRQINVLIVPRANPDGAVRARRLTVNGIDLNRDHLLLRTPEAQAQARLIADYRPIVVVDSHEFPAVGQWLNKYGVLRRNDVLLQYSMTSNIDEFVSRASEEWFRQPLLKALGTARLSVEWYHYLLPDASGNVVAMGSPRPDTSRNVNGLRNSISLLIETRGSDLGRRDIQRRVHGQIVAATTILQNAAQRAADLQKLRNFVDSDISAKACKGTVVIESAATPSEYDLTAIDPDSGADRVISVNWQSTLLLNPKRTRLRPCGYWLSAGQTEAVIRLRLLGVEVMQIPERMNLRGEIYKVMAAAWRNTPAGTENADSGYAQPVPVELQTALIDAQPGSYFVPLTQPLAMLAVAALEPDSPSSYLAHGVIDGADSVARVTSLPPVRLNMVP